MSIPTQPRPSAEADRISLAADIDEHAPYVAASKVLAELTPGAILLRIVLGLVFALSSGGLTTIIPPGTRLIAVPLYRVGRGGSGGSH